MPFTLPGCSPVPELCGILPVGKSHRAYAGVAGSAAYDGANGDASTSQRSQSPQSVIAIVLLLRSPWFSVHRSRRGCMY